MRENETPDLNDLAFTKLLVRSMCNLLYAVSLHESLVEPSGLSTLRSVALRNMLLCIFCKFSLKKSSRLLRMEKFEPTTCHKEGSRQLVGLPFSTLYVLPFTRLLGNMKK